MPPRGRYPGRINIPIRRPRKGYFHFIREGFRLSPLNRRVLGLSGPVVLGMISYTVVWMTDMAMVGVLGTGPQGAVSVGGNIFNVFLSFMMGAGIGIQLLVARRIGEKRESTAGRVLLTSLPLTLMVAALSTYLCWNYGALLATPFADELEDIDMLASYLLWRSTGFAFYFLIFAVRGFFDGIGRTAFGMFSSLVVMAANIFLNWILIFGNLGAPALGLDGAAIASSLAAIPGLVLFVFAFTPKLRKYFEGFNLRDFARWPVVREVTRIGFPTGAENFMMSVAFLVFYIFTKLVDRYNVALYGEAYKGLSKAASGIVVSILSLSFLPGVAFGIAATTILGHALGQGKVTLARMAVYRATYYSALLMGTIGIVFLLLPRPIIGIFASDPRLVAEAFWPLIMVAIVQIPDAINMVMTSAVRSAGMVYWVLARIILIAYCLFLPASYYFGIHLQMGTIGLWIGIVIWVCMACIVFTWKFVKGDWKTMKI